MNKHLKFLLILVVPLLIVAYIMIKPVMTRVYGIDLQLKTRPIDPIDLFTGHYQTLEFADEIVKLPRKDLQPDTAVYIIYESGQVTKVSLTEPKRGVYIKAKVSHYMSDDESNLAEVQFPIDRFYIEEGTGKELEDAFAAGKAVNAHVKVYNGHISLVDVTAK